MFFSEMRERERGGRGDFFFCGLYREVVEKEIENLWFFFYFCNEGFLG